MHRTEILWKQWKSVDGQHEQEECCTTPGFFLCFNHNYYGNQRPQPNSKGKFNVMYYTDEEIGAFVSYIRSMTVNTVLAGGGWEEGGMVSRHMITRCVFSLYSYLSEDKWLNKEWKTFLFITYSASASGQVMPQVFSCVTCSVGNTWAAWRRFSRPFRILSYFHCLQTASLCAGGTATETCGVKQQRDGKKVSKITMWYDCSCSDVLSWRALRQTITCEEPGLWRSPQQLAAAGGSSHCDVSSTPTLVCLQHLMLYENGSQESGLSICLYLFSVIFQLMHPNGLEI